MNEHLLRCWLRRVQQLAPSERERLLLTGSLLTSGLVPHAREVADLDYFFLGEMDVNWVVSFVLQVVTQPWADGATFQFTSHALTSPYDTVPGIRCTVEGRLNGERFPFQIDFFGGDPISQPPQQFTILGVPDVQCCAPEDLWAWKLHGLFEFGPGNWRAKDLYDLAALLHLDFDPDVLRRAVTLAFESRNLPVETLANFVIDGHWGDRDHSALAWHYLRFLSPAEDMSFFNCRAIVRHQVQTLWPERHWLATVPVSVMPDEVLEALAEADEAVYEPSPFSEQELLAVSEALPDEPPDHILDVLAHSSIDRQLN